jgi:hypothetical protein
MGKLVKNPSCLAFNLTLPDTRSARGLSGGGHPLTFKLGHYCGRRTKARVVIEVLAWLWRKLTK